MARFFIDRPIFAWVIAIVIMLAGALSILELPVSQYPSIAPPAIAINARYPGASAKAVEDSVTQVIEQKMTGLDGLLYMNSTSDSYGQATVTLTFSADTDPDIAQVQVQNKMQTALPLLPQPVQQQGVTVAKSARNFLMVVGFVSEDGSQSGTDLSDFLVASVQDPLSRVDGVGEVTVFGSQYSMRVWLDPARLNNYKLTAGDVRAAIEAQNAEVSAGQLGGTPALPGQGFSATITAQSRLQTAEQFENILLRSSTQGGEVRLGDVARVEIGAENYGTVARFNGQPAAGVGIRLASGANALDTATAVRARLDEMQRYFPAGVQYVVPYDTTPFVKISIQEVVKTLVEAVVLVFLVMYLFLQNLRATLIPTIAVPVVLLGTFGVMAAFGFSINTLTMFGIVLAIGLLVDDAIVVVENVERVMTEEGLPPKEATKRSMRQITGALVGIGLVLSAVFVPMAFFGGSTGVIYRQFSITIVSAMALSVLVAIVFTPALCATMLKPIEKGHEHGEGGLFGRFFHWFNDKFQRGTQRYEGAVGGILKRSVRFMLIYVAIVAVLGVLFVRMPTSFLPEEDQGVMFNQVMLPAGATQERTLEVIEKVEQHYLQNEKDAVRAIFTVAGFSFGGSGQNMGIGFVNMRPWDERSAPGLDVQSVANRAMGAFSQIREAMAFAFVPPAVIELGTSGGFTVQMQDRSGLGHEALLAARNQFLGMAAQDSRLVGVRPNGQEDMAELRLDIDHAKAGALGVSVADINETLAMAWGGSYINDFLDRGRIKKVYVQGDASARMTPEDLDKWYVRNKAGEMVPFSAFARSHWTYGSPRLERFNGQPSMEILGQAAPGLSSGEAMQAVEDIMGRLPAGIGYDWSGTSYEERRSGSQAPALYALSLLIVFLCLAALYESWSVPFAVMLVVPLGVLGALLAATGRGMSNDIYFQVGLLATIGLSSKNAILIVEFAKLLMEQEGKGLVEATLEAVRMRLRPIIMTSLAFGFGVLPLAIATGAGAGSQNAIGTGVLGGTIAGTLLGIFFVPLFYVVIKRIFPDKPRSEAPAVQEGR
ncbi:efflux RND transporter permease subunit [Thauera linaloolentis]|uniref:Efflux pump membrane transporter n=1 Tax=Thauera linaloolentis (strain DSM 12138 / JCM 21573 / CCUG 41526 / CIP 105981 / IAM 15112 / NBRC 102519 / 47Lol) TaxID=1123367 RepID=N6Z5J8_THAL4|nr:efflux RND transporter permease subunit [Thauera linaloolentis]ENO87424.1 hydrophobe/amphiphile efflux-1 (HAE1) family transporter [Thauera linaloolentis 47Lol = DSM 12138]MCM8565074.1 efflux RND transporter permease subunit [Thauera linaloolentis]